MKNERTYKIISDIDERLSEIKRRITQVKLPTLCGLDILKKAIVENKPEIIKEQTDKIKERGYELDILMREKRTLEKLKANIYRSLDEEEREGVML